MVPSSPAISTGRRSLDSRSYVVVVAGNRPNRRRIDNQAKAAESNCTTEIQRLIKATRTGERREPH